LKPVQARGPELLEQSPHGIESLGADDVQAPLRLRPHGDEAGVVEHLQMLRDGLLRDVEVFGDLADRARLIPDQAEDRAAPGLGDG
jgi:hypothetical protein